MGFSEQRGSFAEAVGDQRSRAGEEFLCPACLRVHKRHDAECRKFRERRFAQQERERKARESA